MNNANSGKEVKRAFPGVRKVLRRSESRRTTIHQSLAVQEGAEVAALSEARWQQWQ